jgi:hypothetical protein
MRLLRLVIGLDGEELRFRSLLPHEKAPSPVGELGGSLASEGEEIAERNLRQQAGSSGLNEANLGWRGCKIFSVYPLAPTAS